MMRSQSGTLQSFQVWSSDTVAMMGLRGWNATPLTLFRWPRNVLRS
jgi:hypothetical protein